MTEEKPDIYPTILCIALFVAAIVAIFIIDHRTQFIDLGCEEHINTEDIFSLNIGQRTQGSFDGAFFLGIGGVNGEISTQRNYIAYKKNEYDDFILLSVPQDKVALRLQDNESPKHISIIETCRTNSTSPLRDDVMITKNNTIYEYLVVPTNTIKKEYEVN